MQVALVPSSIKKKRKGKKKNTPRLRSPFSAGKSKRWKRTGQRRRPRRVYARLRQTRTLWVPMLSYPQEERTFIQHFTHQRGRRGGEFWGSTYQGFCQNSNRILKRDTGQRSRFECLLCSRMLVMTWYLTAEKKYELSGTQRPEKRLTKTHN